MLKVGDCVVYKRDVCEIKNISEKDNINYYELVPVDDESLKIKIPAHMN